MDTEFRLGVVCGKLGDVDGVSLEVDKWISVFHSLGHKVYTVAGVYVSDLKLVPEENRLAIPEIRFDSDFQRELESAMFPYISPGGSHSSSSKMQIALLDKLDLLGEDIASRIYEFSQNNRIDALIAENTNAMPMALVAAVAIHKLATKHRMAVIFHHHDFWWERSRFSGSKMDNLLHEIMPPTDPTLEHVVISSYAAHNLRTIKRVEPTIIHNCEDFFSAPETDDYNKHFRSELGFKDDDILIVQPTRIVPRKRIEDSIRLVARLVQRYQELDGRVKFVISLYQGDEPDTAYVTRISQLANREGVPIHMISDRVASVREQDGEGRRKFTNRDVLVNADLVTYLPIWEGFGNALLEAVAARVPVVVSTYLVYKTDIMNRGFEGVEIRDDYDEEGRLMIPDSALDEIYKILTTPDLRKRITARSFDAMSQVFGIELLKTKLERLIGSYSDEILASRRRLSKKRKVFSV